MSNAITITEDDFDKKVIQSELPVLVDFYATWCAPCRQVSPVIDALSAEYDGRVLFVKVNVEDCMTLASRYNVGSLPTIITIKDGKEVERLSGMISRNQLAEKIDSLLG